MSVTTSSSQQTPEPHQTIMGWSKPMRILGWGALVVVLAVGFLGYLMPSLRLNWETIAALCGF